MTLFGACQDNEASLADDATQLLFRDCTLGRDVHLVRFLDHLASKE